MYLNTLRIAAAATAVLLLTTAAEARGYSRAQDNAVTCDQRGCSDWARAASGASAERRPARRAARQAHSMRIDKPQQYVKPATPGEKLVTREAHEAGTCRGNRGSTSLARVVEPLKSKAEEIVRACGAHIVSTDCRGGATPNHRQGKAVDIAMRGRASPACIYAHLRDWPGGVSTDYWSAPGTRHVHFSYSRRHEWGLRFAHGHAPRHQRVARLR